MTQCEATLGAKTSSGTYFAALCRVSEPHRIHVFELRRTAGETLVVVVDEAGYPTPPALLDRAERVLADEAERVAAQRRADEAAELERRKACSVCGDEAEEGMCAPCNWAATEGAP